MTGTTGAGKTNAFHTLLPEIQTRGDKAIIVDLTGDYVGRYFQPGRDILLNPLDGRSALWSPWADTETEEDIDSLAASIPPAKRKQRAFLGDGLAL